MMRAIAAALLNFMTAKCKRPIAMRIPAMAPVQFMQFEAFEIASHSGNA
jgi:hypothetical protein